MSRSGLLFAWSVIALAAALLTAESLLPGQVLLPLLPDDFPTWQQGRDEGEPLARHPAPNWSMSDVDHLLVPGLAVTAAALERGGLPHWDPSQALGVPHLAQVHYAVLYPPAWLALLFGLKGLGALAFVHLLVAGVGMLHYLHALGRSPTAALTGALAFAFSAWLTARLQSFPAAGAAVWLPWILWGLERAAATGRSRHLAVAALALTLSLLAGFPQVSLLVGCLAAGIEGVRLLTHLRGASPEVRRRQWRGSLLALAALGSSALLAAPQLLPTASYLLGASARVAQDPAIIARQALEWPLLQHLVAPDFYASAGLTGFHPLALLALDGATLPATLNRPEVSLGVGTLGLLLAALAMLFGRTWITRTWTAVVLAVFALLLSPALLELGARWLPPLRLGDPRRLLLLSTAGLAVLAAGGVDLITRERMRITVVAWALALSITGWAVALMLAVPSVDESEDLDAWALELARRFELAEATPQEIYAGVPIPPENFRAAAHRAFRSALVALAVALAAVVLFRPRSTSTQRGWSSLAQRSPEVLTLVLSAELLVAAFPLLRSAPVRGLLPDSRQLELPAPPVLEAVRETLGPRVVPPRIVRQLDDPPWLRPNFPVLFGLLDLQAYAPMVPRRTQQLLAAFAPGTAISGSHVGGLPTAAELSSPLVDLLGVEVVLASDPALAVEGLDLVAQVGGIAVYRNAEAYPHAWFAERWIVEQPAAPPRLAWVHDPTFDGRTTVVLEGDLPAGPAPLGTAQEPASESTSEPGAVPDAEPDAEPGSGPGSEPGTDRESEPQSEPDPGPGAEPVSPAPLVGARSVQVLAWAPGELELHLGSGPAGALVVAESFDEGWTAEVDGRSAPVVPADHALLAVSVGAGGAARVDLRHRTAGLALGTALAAGTLALAAAAAALRWGRLRRVASALPAGGPDA